MNKHFSILEGLNSFINSSLHKTFLLLISLSLTTSLWSVEQTASANMSDIASANNWTTASGSGAQPCYTSFSLDANITISTSGAANCGSFWGTDWRIYQAQSGDVTITAATGCTLQSATFTYTNSNGGSLYDGSTAKSSGSPITLSGSTKTLSVGSTTGKTNGQVRITAISVTYDSGGSTKTLESIAVQTAPTKVAYFEGETFDPAGLVITRNYNTGDPDTYAYGGHESDFSFTPSTSTPLTMSNTSITITYGGKSTTQAITVTSSGGGGGTCGVFHESWNNTEGSGGNDGTWSGTIAQATIVEDESGWSYSASNGGGNACIKLGAGSSAGSATSPSISVANGGAYTLTVKAAPWGTTASTLTIELTGAKFSDNTTSKTTSAMSTQTWNTFSFDIITTATTMSIDFSSSENRFFLDDVCISEATSYTITAHSDNELYGTVSVSGNIITATPASGYVPDGYTLNSGTVSSVTQSGNTYTVVATGDCDITINFRAATSYTITLIDNNTSWTETAYEGTPYTLPDEYKSTCPDATFLGWANGEYTNHATGTSVAPSYTAGGENVDITANTTFVAVYGNVELGDNYAALKAEAELTSNANYVVAAYHSDDYIIKATTSEENRIDSYQTSLTLADTGNEVTDTKLIWRINVLDAATKTVTFYNEDINKYLSINGDNALCFDDDPFAFTYTVDESGNAATWVFTSTTNTDYKLAFYSTYHKFNAYTTGSNLYLYKQLADNETYTSHPNCCHEPANSLTITSDAGTFVGSGVAHLTLEGGNSQTITWSATGGTLSEQTNTGATLTLSAPGTYTVTATQPDNETDPDNVICGATVTTNITVKAQWTITLKTKDDGTASTYDTQTVTDGETYTLPDLSEDYTCEDGYAFAGWATSESATAVEKIAGSVITASASTTWWAVWQSSSGDTETVTKWEKVSATSDLAANTTFVLAYGTNAMGTSISDGWAASAVVQQDADKTYVAYPSSTTDVQILTLKGSTGAWKFYSTATSQWLAMTAAGKISWTDTEGDAATFTITLSGSDAYIYNNAATSNEYLKYNAGSPRFKGYAEGSCVFASLYKDKGNTVTISSSSGVSYFVNNEHCNNGAIIKVDGAWITAAKGQKVKAVIPVVAKNFDASSTLAVSNISDSHFKATLAETAIPAGSTGLTTTLTVEYLPDASDVLNATTITLSAGDVTKTITVNGRSLPDEFLLITKKTLWYAVPANMNEGAGQYNGVAVVPNDGSEPDNVPVAPSTVVYSLKSVASARYETAGQYVRLAGLGSKALWANGSAGVTTIYNNAAIGESNDSHYEWALSTTDGIRYTITNPAHPDAASGRQLALGGTSGIFFGFYKTATTFFIVPAGCTSQPQEVNVSARRTDATFSWVSNASSMVIDVYTNSEMTEGHLSATATSSPYMFLGLKEETEYWFKLTPDGDDACAVTGSFKTTGPVIDIVEWEENKAIIFVDKDEELHPKVIIDGEVEHGQGTGSTATDIFFSKYFEAEGTAKMLGVFNGTTEDIPLADITIVQRSLSGEAKAFSLASYGATKSGYIKAGEEILFYTRDNRDAVMECAEADPTFPNWNNVDGKEGSSNFNFGGKGTIRLFRGDKCIDIIGAMVEGNDIDDKTQATAEGSSSPSWAPVRDNEKGFVTAYGDNYLTKDIEESDYGLSSCRCLLIRKSFVTSGDSAVLNNFGDFKTLGVYTGVDSKVHKGEWAGLQIPDAAVGEKDYIHTCQGFQEVGQFDYSQYYKEWDNINPGIDLDGKVVDTDAKLYGIEIPNLAQYSCLNLRFQLTDKDDVTHIYTEQEVQVPIIVKGGSTTVDAIFNEIVKKDDATHTPLYDQSIERCKTCNVVVLGTGVLTKATDGTTHDAPEIGNLKVYPGGKVVVPEGTTYTVNSLALRRQEDALSLAQVEGTLAIKQPNSTFLDIRIDPSNWHYFTLPYDVNVSDIKFVDGTPAAIGTDYRIGTYDGEHRAATQSASWVYLNSEDVLKAGLGYIIGLPGSGKIQRELRFPMANEVITAEKTDKDIAGFHAWGGDKTDEELRPNHKGWNLLGAPYLTYYQTSLQDPLPTGELIHDPDEDPWQGHWVRNTGSLRYIVVPVDNGRSEYQQVNIANYHMAPFTSYFVQIGGSNPATDQTISYTASQAGKLSIVRRAVQEEVEDNHEVWFGVELVNADGLKDETALLISDKFTNDYDIMDDLVKMRGQYYQYAQITTKPVLASRNLKGEMAFNALPDSTAAAGVPLNFFAAKDGEYRFTISGNYPLDEVKSAYLYDNDNATQKWHNLMESDYTFTTKRGDNSTRFMLAVTVERKQPEVTTALDNMSSKLTLTTINRTLVLSGLISESDIYVYDVSGKLLSTSQYNTSASGVFRTTVENAGVYFVRVCSQDGQQTLQTIVY